MTVAATGLRFVVFGRPQQKGSKQVLPVKGPRRFVVRESNARARPWALNVSAAAREAYHGQLIHAPVTVAVTFYFARPKGHYGTGRNLLELRPRASGDDRDARRRQSSRVAPWTRWTGVVFHDDAQITDLHAAKRYGEPERRRVHRP